MINSPEQPKIKHRPFRGDLSGFDPARIEKGNDDASDYRLCGRGKQGCRIPISAMTLWRWMIAGKFPKPVVANRGCHRLWRLADVAAWQEAHLREPEADH
jgi:predicted DNA-binding transcriptional regulator AlpA